MRTPASMGVAVLLLGACNAILGNESDYRLDSDVAVGGEVGTGNQSSGGATSKAGSGSVAGKTNTGSGGDDVGSAGSGGEPPECDPSGTENCFNGFDDDCNGDVDCEDAACIGPAECVPVPAGANLGSFGVTTACPPGTTEVTLHQGLTADPSCTGCTCTPHESYCDSSIVGLTCGQSVVGANQNLFSSGCQNVTPANGASIRFYNIRGFSDCTAVGTPTLSAVSWAKSSVFCQVDALGAGCPAGSRCVAKAAEPTCSVRSGDIACNDDYPMTTGEPWSSDYVDQRECNACQCGFGISNCNGGSIQLYSGANCQGTMVTLGGAGGDDCGLAFTPASGILTGSPATNTCEPQAYPSGELKPKDSSTICCQ